MTVGAGAPLARGGESSGRPPGGRNGRHAGLDQVEYGEKNPPAREIAVVHAPHAHGNTRQDDTKLEEVGQRWRLGENQNLGEPGEQSEVPVLRAGSDTFEVNVLRKTGLD